MGQIFPTNNRKTMVTLGLPYNGLCSEFAGKNRIVTWGSHLCYAADELCRLWLDNKYATWTLLQFCFIWVNSVWSPKGLRSETSQVQQIANARFIPTRFLFHISNPWAAHGVHRKHVLRFSGAYDLFLADTTWSFVREQSAPRVFNQGRTFNRFSLDFEWEGPLPQLHLTVTVSWRTVREEGYWLFLKAVATTVFFRECLVCPAVRGILLPNFV